MKRVLVVEDEASIREMVALNLKMAGWEVVEAPSAERALELMHSGERCDAALLDIMLPGMDGLSLCETIRRGDSDIGIIIVSAKGLQSQVYSAVLCKQRRWRQGLRSPCLALPGF